MAIGFVGITQIASGGATDPMSAPSMPASVANGNMVLLFVQVKFGSGTGGVTINTPTDWTLVSNTTVSNTGLTNGSNDEGNVRACVFAREKTAGWSTMPAVDLSGVPDCTMRGAIAYSKGASETWDTVIGASAADDAVSATGVNPSASGTTIALASGDWLISYGALNGNLGTLGTHTCTVSGVTFGSSNTRLAGSTTSGTDMLGDVIDMAYSSGTASAGPDGALPVTGGDTNGAGVMCFVRLRLAAGDVSANPAAVPLTVAVPTPTATAGGDRTPAADALVLALPTPTAREDVFITPAPVALTLALPTPAFTATGERTPDPVALTMTVPGPTATAGGDRTPDPVVLSTTIPTPTAAESISRTPDPVSLSTGIPAPAPTAGGGR